RSRSALCADRRAIRYNADSRRTGGGRGAGGAAARSAAARDEGAWRADADAASPGRGHAGRGGRDRLRRYAPVRQAAIHLVPAPARGIPMGEAGTSEGMASTGAGLTSLAMTLRERACLQGAFLPSPNARNHVKLRKSRCLRLPLTSGAWPL